MSDDNMKTMADLLKQFSQQKKLKKPLQEARIVNMWKPLMGDLVDRYTSKIYVNNKVLFVEVKVASLKNELLYLQEEIIEKINTQIGEKAITKLVIL